MRDYNNYGDMNHILNELFDKDVIQDFRDKGQITWVLFESIPLIVYAPYGLRYEYIIIAPYLNEEEQVSYFSTRSASLYEGISLAYIRLMKLKNNAHLLQLDYIDDNETVFLEMQSYEYYQT